MSKSSSHPLLYELNTRCWLAEVSRSEGRRITLENVPESELAGWKLLGFTHIWLMGVWRTGQVARERALASEGLCAACRDVLPDWRMEDLGASPYAVAGYEVESGLGGGSALAHFRERLHRAGLRLILDFVPNHLGLDHPWKANAPGYFVQSPVEADETFQARDAAGATRWLAHGKDPYFPAWNDTVQLDYRLAATRDAMAEQLASVAAQCDGVRCDMAMLLLPDVFEKNWRHLPPVGAAAPGDFWADNIPRIRRVHPGFLFLAEAYWGLEGRLQDCGFDYTYDKVLLDLLIERNTPAVLQHVLSMPAKRLAAGTHFLENHDEPRICGRLSPEELRAAVLLILTLPGMRFLHEGQLEGWQFRAPVQLLRRSREVSTHHVSGWYRQLLQLLPGTAIGKGAWRLHRLQNAGTSVGEAPDVLIIQWMDPGSTDLAVINLGPHTRSGCVSLEAQTTDQRPKVRQLFGPEFTPKVHEAGSRLEVVLPPYAAGLLRVTPFGNTRTYSSGSRL